MTQSITPKQIDAILPQTQCELCGYPGCMPYAKAIVANNEKINLCPPGGVSGLIALAELVNQDPSPFIEDMQQKAKPFRLAVIREAECIGCTKCIQACPVDAILGAAKQMHSVIADECTGCELCIAPCPVDCIDMVVVSEGKINSTLARARYTARKQRLENKQRDAIQNNIPDQKAYIQAAIMRARNKKSPL